MGLEVHDGDVIRETIEQAVGTAASYWDARIISGTSTSIERKDSEVKKVINGSETGAGIRVLCNGAWGFGYTNDVTRTTLRSLIASAIKRATGSSAKLTEKIVLGHADPITAEINGKPLKNPLDITIEEKMAVLSDAENALKEYNELITVSTGYSDGTGKKLFINSEGAAILTSGTVTFARAQFVAKDGHDMTSGSERLGATRGFEVFAMHDFTEMCRRKAESTINMLNASHPPSGRYPVIMDHDLTGVFAHEAVGHATEGDLITMGDSILENKMGAKIGSKHVSISDDPTMHGAFGSFAYDDEGVKATKKVLIKNGVLKGYILNRETAHKLHLQPNGGARAESFASRPIVRMSNTVIENGDHSFEELLEDIKYGIYACGSRGGQVDTGKGTFQFSAQEAFLIKDGEITKPLRDVSLSGATLEILQKIDAVGNDFRLGSPGFCGKGQIVPVSDGGPHVRISEAIVGGR